MNKANLCGGIVALGLMSGTASAQQPIVGVEAEAMRSPEVVQDATPFRMTEADRRITERVMLVLQADEMLRGRIAVSSIGGVVQLSGMVDSVPMIYRAVELARRVDAVSQVEVDRLYNT